MAFESLSEKLQNTFKDLKGQGVLTEKDIDNAMRDIKLSLLEADVNFKVVKEFVKETKEECMGADVMESLTPAQQVVKIVDKKLTDLMGGAGAKITYSPTGFTTIMMAGLQGTGKTTTCGKLANYLKQCGKHPMLAACDIYRPAAIDQLEVVAKAVNTPVYIDRECKDAVKIAKDARAAAENKGCNVLVIDTAGRLQIDEELMDELSRMKKELKPHEILLVVDALSGQDAVNAAQGFNDRLGIDGMILTKMDGDARGGAALSAKKVTGKPIFFLGTGEKYDALEPFHPDRMASRILGMGDVLTLIEAAEQAYDDEQAAKLEEKIKKNQRQLTGGFRIRLDKFWSALVYVMNVDDGEKTLGECVIYRISVPSLTENYKNEANLAFDFPLNITKDELVKSAGEPEGNNKSHYDGEKYYTDTYSYKQKSKKFLGSKAFTFEFKNDVLNKVELDYIP